VSVALLRWCGCSSLVVSTDDASAAAAATSNENEDDAAAWEFLLGSSHHAASTVGPRTGTVVQVSAVHFVTWAGAKAWHLLIHAESTLLILVSGRCVPVSAYPSKVSRTVNPKLRSFPEYLKWRSTLSESEVSSK